MSVRPTTFSIGDVANKFGTVTARQLRNWEELGYLGKVDRSVCGMRAYRRYTLDQVELIQKISEYQEQGFTLAAAAEKARATLRAKGGRI